MVYERAKVTLRFATRVSSPSFASKICKPKASIIVILRNKFCVVRIFAYLIMVRHDQRDESPQGRFEPASVSRVSPDWDL